MDVVVQYFVKTITITIIDFIFRVIVIKIFNPEINYSNLIDNLIDYASLVTSDKEYLTFEFWMCQYKTRCIHYSRQFTINFVSLCLINKIIIKIIGKNTLQINPSNMKHYNCCAHYFFTLNCIYPLGKFIQRVSLSWRCGGYAHFDRPSIKCKPLRGYINE